MQQKRNHHSRHFFGDYLRQLGREHHCHRGHDHQRLQPSDLVTKICYPLWQRWLHHPLGYGSFQVGTPFPSITYYAIKSPHFPPSLGLGKLQQHLRTRPSFLISCTDVSIVHIKMDLMNVCVVGGNAVSAFLSWRLQATNACDVTLVWKSGFDAVYQYGISFKYVLSSGMESWIVAEH